LIGDLSISLKNSESDEFVAPVQQCERVFRRVIHEIHLPAAENARTGFTIWEAGTSGMDCIPVFLRSLPIWPSGVRL
jgi:hypothetical protein